MVMVIIEKRGMVRSMNDENKIDIMALVYKLLSVIQKTWKSGVIIIILCTALSVGNAYRKYTPVYSSKVTFSVIKDFNGISTFNYNKAATDKLANSFLTIMNSDLMVSAICQDLKVSSVPATFRIERIESTNLFSIYATSPTPEDAKNTLDALMRNYTQISKVALNDATLTVIEEPVLSTKPSNQIQYKYKALKGVVLGTAIFSVIVLLYAFLRRTFSKESDVKLYLHCKCLGSIGVLKEMRKRKPLLITKDLIGSRKLKDSFRKIRLSVESDHRKNQNKSYMLTSTLPNEGKSMIAANLALSLATKGKKVLLIDFDLRNPSQSRTFELEQENAVEKKEIRDTVFYKFNGVEHDNLDIFCTFEGMENASELLSSKEAHYMITTNKRYYDYIIVDTPPIQLMADANIVARHADAAILVIKEDYAIIEDVREAMQMLQHAKIEVLGVILNQVKGLPIFSAKYGYGYGYGYGRYGSGYGETGKE